MRVSKPWTGLAAAVLLVAVAGCSTTTAPAPTPVAAAAPPVAASVPAPSDAASAKGNSGNGGDYASQLAAARDARTDALAVPVPKYSGSGSKESKLAFIEGPGKTWFETVRPKVDAAAARFEQALASAPNDEARSVVLAEAADVDVVFSERFLLMGRRGQPTAWRSNPELDQVFTDSMMAALSPFRERARLNLDRCGTAAGCQTVRARLDALTEPAPASRATHG